MSDYYAELGVSRNATDEEIRAAYRRKAKDLHPDRTGGDVEKMVRVNRAHEVLSDKQKRLTYDRTGQDTAPPRDQVASAIIVQFASAWVMAEHNSGDMVAEIGAQIDAQLIDGLHQVKLGLQARARLEKRLERLKPRKNKGDHPQHELIV